MQRRFRRGAAALAPRKGTQGCRRGDGHHPPAGSSRAEQPGSIGGAVLPGDSSGSAPSLSGSGGLADGRAAGTWDHGLGRRRKGDAAWPPVPFSIPLLQAHLWHHPARVPSPSPGQGDRFLVRRGFLTVAAAPVSAGSDRSEALSPVRGQIPAPRCSFAPRLGAAAPSEELGLGGGIAAPSSSPGSAPAARCLPIPSPALFAQPD